jgi:predicted secreted protein
MSWWLFLFMVLPFGVVRDEKPEVGNDSGAPVESHIKIKFVISTILSTILTSVFFYFQYYV